jgi:hypothetical protein
LIDGGVLWAMKKQAGVIDDVNGARESWIELLATLLPA